MSGIEGTAELGIPQLPEGLDTVPRISFSRLIYAVGENAADLRDEIDGEVLRLATPQMIWLGLYVPREDPRFTKSQNTYNNVVFSAADFLVLARSPADLGKHSYSQNLAVNDRRPPGEKVTDRDEAHRTASRAAGHQLEKQLGKVEGLQTRLFDERASLLALWKEIKSRGFAHYGAKKLDALRVQGHLAIQDSVEVASVNLSWNNETVEEVQKAIYYILYAGNNNARLENWQTYVRLAGRYARAKIQATDRSRKAIGIALDSYSPYLESTETDGK